MRIKPGFATWHMFVTAERALMDLYAEKDGKRRVPINPWDYLPHSFLSMNEPFFEFFLTYLHDVHDLRIFGNVLFVSGDTQKQVSIIDSRIT